MKNIDIAILLLFALIVVPLLVDRKVSKKQAMIFNYLPLKQRIELTSHSMILFIFIYRDVLFLFYYLILKNIR